MDEMEKWRATTREEAAQHPGYGLGLTGIVIYVVLLVVAFMNLMVAISAEVIGNLDKFAATVIYALGFVPFLVLAPQYSQRTPRIATLSMWFALAVLLVVRDDIRDQILEIVAGLPSSIASSDGIVALLTLLSPAAMTWYLFFSTSGRITFRNRVPISWQPPTRTEKRNRWLREIEGEGLGIHLRRGPRIFLIALLVFLPLFSARSVIGGDDEQLVSLIISVLFLAISLPFYRVLTGSRAHVYLAKEGIRFLAYPYGTVGWDMVTEVSRHHRWRQVFFRDEIVRICRSQLPPITETGGWRDSWARWSRQVSAKFDSDSETITVGLGIFIGPMLQIITISGEELEDLLHLCVEKYGNPTPGSPAPLRPTA